MSQFWSTSLSYPGVLIPYGCADHGRFWVHEGPPPEILEEDHNIVGEAENGVEAVELYREEQPDIVFMDIVMPIKDGIEATGEITDMDPNAKVVMCTSVEQAEQMKDSIKAGAEGYITKPFQKESVLEELNSIAAE